MSHWIRQNICIILDKIEVHKLMKVIIILHDCDGCHGTNKRTWSKAIANKIKYYTDMRYWLELSSDYALDCEIVWVIV